MNVLSWGGAAKREPLSGLGQVFGGEVNLSNLDMFPNKKTAADAVLGVFYYLVFWLVNN